MVYHRSSISVCKSVGQSRFRASSMMLADPKSKFKLNNHAAKKKKMPNSPNSPKIPTCNRSRSAAIDVVILIAVIGAFGFLLFPYVKFIILEFTEILGGILYLIGEEVSHAPWIYGSVGFSIFCTALAAWVILICSSRKCGNPNCKGLQKAAEFDIQLETEEYVKNSTPQVKNEVRNGFFELPRDYHRGLESELKKMAPPNGKAVLIFQARCGCSVGRLEVPGTKKNRKMK